MDGAFRGWNDAWLDPRFRDVFDIVEPLAYIRVPVLIVQGEDDPYGSLSQIAVAEEECYCPVEAVVLKIWGDLSMPEAAAVAGVSEKTFEHRYYRGLAALKEKLGGNPP